VPHRLPPAVCRSRHLVSYWTDQGTVVCNYATGRSVVADPASIYVLGFCGEWRTIADVRRELKTIPRRSVDSLIREMLEHTLLVARGARASREDAMSSWLSWNPAAGFFHFSTKNMPVMENREAAEQALAENRKTGGAPPSTKRYPHSPVIPLASAEAAGEFPEVLRSRRTWRDFSSEPVSVADVGTLLGLTCGVQRTAESLTSGRVHLKTSPSSGARQPLEAYLLAVNVSGLEPGLYHYAPDAHQLESIKKGATAGTIARYVPGQWWYEPAAALFILTAVFARTQWRYKFPRAYRSVLLEAGHVCQTFCLVATWLGLAPFCTGRFADAVVERDIKADGITESFVYGGGVGQRPPGVEWAPWPIAAAGSDHPLERPRRRAVQGPE